MTMTLPAAPVEVPDDQPRYIGSVPTAGDRIFRSVLRGGGVMVFVIVGLIAFFLILQSVNTFRTAGWKFFTTMTWLLGSNHFGIAAALPDGVIIALIALVIAVPIALLCSLFISEYAPARFKRGLIALIDLMAAIPSIIYALWGAKFLMPAINGTIRWMSDHLGFLPFLKVRGGGTTESFSSSPFIAGLVVSLMVIPIIVSITREVFSQAPSGEREAAYALGSTKWGVIRTVVLPYGRGGIIGATMLGFGRALGETIVVSLIISPSFTLTTHILESGGMSIPALIALRYQESTPEMLSALMAAGLVLFAVTLLVNSLAGIIVARSRSGLQTAD